ncbi:hypothetical protein ACIQWR_01910 [Streptomyces sp. NPDC098789]|uniref:hypothetical protein n=1 Tax=Streptomyces sp. NPDC098789 TaxID=3366098 RepID=UPI003807F201
MDMRTWRDGHARAADALESLRAALVGLGVPEAAWTGMWPTVTSDGLPHVHLGMLPADAVERMAEALRGAEAAAR